MNKVYNIIEDIKDTNKVRNIGDYPVTPRFFDWAFNRERTQTEYDHRKENGLEAKLIIDHRNLIPKNTNVLITHGPSLGILDKVERKGSINLGEHVGCEELFRKIQDLKELKLSVFGHIHSGHGQITQNRVKYINASVCDERYDPINPPITHQLQ